MVRMKRSVVLSFGVVVLSLAASAAAAPCFEAISPEGAKKLFDALAAAKPSDGCTLENVTTDRVQMRVEWMKAGRLQEAIVVLASSCAPTPNGKDKVSVVVPDATASACPEASEATRGAVEAGVVGELVTLADGISAPPPPPSSNARPRVRRKQILIGGGVALGAAIVGGVAFAVRARRRKKGSTGAATTPDPKTAEPLETPSESVTSDHATSNAETTAPAETDEPPAAPPAP